MTTTLRAFSQRNIFRQAQIIFVIDLKLAGIATIRRRKLRLSLPDKQREDWLDIGHTMPAFLSQVPVPAPATHARCLWKGASSWWS